MTRIRPRNRDVCEAAMRSSGYCFALLLLAAAARAEDTPKQKPATEIQPLPPSLLGPNVAPIDLPSALRLAGLLNPEIMLARERVVRAAALHQLAAAHVLPNLHARTSL